MTEGPGQLSQALPAAATEHWATLTAATPAWNWPGGAEVAVSLSFDVDAETACFELGDEGLRRLTKLSDGRFSVVRGVSRILELLRRYELPSTFFVPGWTAENYPHVVASILDAGHEIGHHGYAHLRSDNVSVDAQEEEIERGFAALEAVGAPRPRGYRSPGWEVSPETFRMVVSAGFLYDTSFMSDDRPYVERYDDLQIIELPSHWSLDDWAYFDPSHLTSAEAWRQNWWTEYENARDERRNVNYACHPEISGRGYRTVELGRLLERILSDGRAWFATMEEIARHVEPILRRPA